MQRVGDLLAACYGEEPKGKGAVLSNSNITINAGVNVYEGTSGANISVDVGHDASPEDLKTVAGMLDVISKDLRARAEALEPASIKPAAGVPPYQER